MTASDRGVLLARLQNQVSQAIDEIERLRQENEALAERVRALEDDPGAFRDEAVVTLENGSDELRQQIKHFINTIDRHLEHLDAGISEDT